MERGEHTVHPTAWSIISNYVHCCLEGDDWEILKVWVAANKIFEPEKRRRSNEGQVLFHEFLRPLLTAEPEAEKRMCSLMYPRAQRGGPDFLDPISTALTHPDCPPVLLAQAARHSWFFFRRNARLNPACPEEDQIYAVLMGDTA